MNIRNLIPLKGNHDDWLLEFILTDFHPVKWDYGGQGTLISYLNHAGKHGKYFFSGSGYKTALVKEDVLITHRHFFEGQQPYFIDDQQRCFIHAGLNRHLSFYKQQLSEFYWNRDLWNEALNHQLHPEDFSGDFYGEDHFKEIFIGHTPTTNFDTDKPMQAFNIFNLDTGAGHKGRLTIMDIDTEEYWQSNPVLSLYTEWKINL